MRARLAFAAFVLMASLLPARAALAADAVTTDPPFPAAKRAAIEATLTRSFGETGAPGVIVGIWIPGEGTFVTAKGVADIKTRAPMRIADHFRVGSITKTFTATALLILVDEGKLGLDDPVGKYVSWVPNGDNITLRMLADMTSGLHNYTEDDAWVNEVTVYVGGVEQTALRWTAYASSGSSQTVTVPNLTNGVTYTFKVRGMNGSYYGPYHYSPSSSASGAVTPSS